MFNNGFLVYLKGGGYYFADFKVQVSLLLTSRHFAQNKHSPDLLA